MDAAVKTGAAAGVGIGWAGGHTLGSQAAVSSLIALDPTGTFFRFTKILQIVNKLYFININYGKRLDVFLWGIHSTPQNKDSPKTREANARIYRGKLTYQIQALDMVEATKVNTVFYMCSWALLAMRYLLMKLVTLSGSAIKALYYLDHVHLIIFNLVFIDFIWLAPRTYNHLATWQLSKLVIGDLTLLLLCIDLFFICSHIFSVFYWSEYLYRLTSFYREVHAENYNAQVDQDRSSSNLHSIKSYANHKFTAEELEGLGVNVARIVPAPEASDVERVKQINYKKTYFEIELNRPLMRMLTWNFTLNQKACYSPLCRYLSFLPWSRISMYQILIVTCQYANTMALLIMFFFELGHLALVIYAYLKYKYLKNIICLLMELTTPLFMALFLLIGLFLSPKSFEDVIMDFYQDAGIWIVIASCVAEYLLLITYIAVAAYEYFKNRKMMKKMNVMSHQLIHYEPFFEDDKAYVYNSNGQPSRSQGGLTGQQSSDPKTHSLDSSNVQVIPPILSYSRAGPDASRPPSQMVNAPQNIPSLINPSSYSADRPASSAYSPQNLNPPLSSNRPNQSQVSANPQLLPSQNASVNRPSANPSMYSHQLQPPANNDNSMLNNSSYSASAQSSFSNSDVK